MGTCGSVCEPQSFCETGPCHFGEGPEHERAPESHHFEGETLRPDPQDHHQTSPLSHRTGKIPAFHVVGSHHRQHSPTRHRSPSPTRVTRHGSRERAHKLQDALRAVNAKAVDDALLAAAG